MNATAIYEAMGTIERMSDAQFEAFLAILPDVITDEDKQTMRLHRAGVKLFTNEAYYRAVKEAFKEVVGVKIWEAANA